MFCSLPVPRGCRCSRRGLIPELLRRREKKKKIPINNSEGEGAGSNLLPRGWGVPGRAAPSSVAAQGGDTAVTPLAPSWLQLFLLPALHPALLPLPGRFCCRSHLQQHFWGKGIHLSPSGHPPVPHVTAPHVTARFESPQPHVRLWDQWGGVMDGPTKGQGIVPSLLCPLEPPHWHWDSRDRFHPSHGPGSWF